MKVGLIVAINALRNMTIEGTNNSDMLRKGYKICNWPQDLIYFSYLLFVL